MIIEVAPEKLYDELLTEIFLGSLFDISSHYCGNYVAQTLISSARNSNQVFTENKTSFEINSIL